MTILFETKENWNCAILILTKTLIIGELTQKKTIHSSWWGSPNCVVRPAREKAGEPRKRHLDHPYSKEL